MRNDAKASNAGSTDRTRRTALALSAFAAVLAAVALSAPPARAAAPTIADTWSEDVVFTEAILKARINPEGKATTYRFEYGTTEAYGSQTPDLPVGSDSSPHEVSRFLEGLTPGTTYHFRAVATNPDGETLGPDTTFTTYRPLAPDAGCPNQAVRYGPSATLPDCRAYEMVSPVDKAGKGIVVHDTLFDNFGVNAVRQATPGGGKLTYSSMFAFGDQAAGHHVNQYIATRTASGWSTHGINAPQGTTITDPGFGFPELYRFVGAFTQDLSKAWAMSYNRVPLAPGAREDFPNLYRRDNLADTYEPITTVTPLAGDADYTPAVVGFSDDGSRVFIAARAALTADAALNDSIQLYEHSGGELELISVLPGGEAASAGSLAGADGTLTRGVVSWTAILDNAVSEDGSRVFWSSERSIFVRIDGETTVPVSESVSGEEAEFRKASADGSKALFVIEKSGGFEAPPQPLEDNLYLFDVDTETPTLIAGEVEGVADAAEDLSRVYFASSEVLAPGAVAGEPNLYLWEEGAIRLIGSGSSSRSITQVPMGHHARSTPDGSRLVFMSSRSLTGYESIDEDSGEPLEQVFLYDAETEVLRCLSCNPSGVRPDGGDVVDTLHFQGEAQTGSLFRGKAFPSTVAAWLPTWGDSLNELRPISADGKRVFFNSFDALLPHDTNGVGDVYQWEEPGTGSCDASDPEFSEANGGCIHLISTGKSAEPSEFTEASADGSSVFIETESSIVPDDPGLNDIYVARVGGGYPQDPAPIPCVGDACQDIPSPPNDPTPASAGFRGAGNPVPAPNCGATARRAAKLSRAAKRSRKAARRISRGAKRSAAAKRKSRALRRRSARLAKRAKRVSRNAKRCRRANRRAKR